MCLLKPLVVVGLLVVALFVVGSLLIIMMDDVYGCLFGLVVIAIVVMGVLGAIQQAEDGNPWFLISILQ